MYKTAWAFKRIGDSYKIYIMDGRKAGGRSRLSNRSVDRMRSLEKRTLQKEFSRLKRERAAGKQSRPGGFYLSERGGGGKENSRDKTFNA